MRVTSFAASGAATAALAWMAACGSQRPPELDSTRGAGSPAAVGGATFDPDASLATQTCDMGPDRGVCSCIDLTVLSDAPTLYFVLDHSGSMQEDDRWQTVRTVVTNVVRRLGPRARYGITVFPGSRSPCGAGDEVMPVRAGDAPAGTYGPTTKLVLAATNVAAVGGTPTAATLAAVLERLHGRPERTFVVLATDGGPNCNPQAACGADRCIPNIEGISAQCQPNGSNCCANQSEQCLDADPMLEGIARLKNAGIGTYVIGVPGSQIYASLLDRAAQAGGTARQGSPLYYRVDTSDSEALSATLAQIAAKITATCDYPLSDVPDPTQINVYLDDEVIPQDGDDGWVLDGSTVRLRGRTCSRVQEGQALGVRVVAGCPTVVPR